MRNVHQGVEPIRMQEVKNLMIILNNGKAAQIDKLIREIFENDGVGECIFYEWKILRMKNMLHVWKWDSAWRLEDWKFSYIKVKVIKVNARF